MTEIIKSATKIGHFLFLFFTCFHLVKPWPKGGFEEEGFDFDSPLVADEVPSYFNQGKTFNFFSCTMYFSVSKGKVGVIILIGY